MRLCFSANNGDNDSPFVKVVTRYETYGNDIKEERRKENREEERERERRRVNEKEDGGRKVELVSNVPLPIAFKGRTLCTLFDERIGRIFTRMLDRPPRH